MNIFYHFTTKDLAHLIKTEGLSKGMTPTRNGFVTMTQWLTKEGDPEHQEGLKGPLNLYDRTEARVKVNIPHPFMKKVLSFDDFCNRFDELYGRELPSDFKTFPELSKDWYVFVGHIPASWILNVRYYTQVPAKLPSVQATALRR